jgi:hypothetical protein
LAGRRLLISPEGVITLDAGTASLSTADGI